MQFHLPIFMHIVNILDVHFQGQKFESSTLGSSYVIILQIVTDVTNIAIANKHKIEYNLYIYIFPFDLGLLKVKFKFMHISSFNIL